MPSHNWFRPSLNTSRISESAAEIVAIADIESLLLSVDVMPKEYA